MRMRTALAPVAALVLLVPPVSGRGQDRGEEQPAVQFNITAEMRAQDPRLKTPVTLRIRHATIGDLLETISQQTGVKLVAGERDGAADEPVAAFCKATPLGDVLDALWSLMSYRPGEWTWERTGSVGTYRYVLTETVSAQRLRGYYAQWIQNQFERNARILLAAVDGTPAQKQAAIEAVYGAQDIPDRSIPSDLMWAQLRIIKEGLSPDQQASILSGDTTGPIAVPTSRLSAASRAAVHSAFLEYARYTHKYVNGVEVPITEPDSIRIARGREYGVPYLAVGYASGRNAPFLIGGATLLLAYWNTIKTDWALPGDSADDPAGQRRMAPPPDRTQAGVAASTAGPDPSPHTTALEQRLEQLADGAGVPLLARLPGDEPDWSLPAPNGMTLDKYWTKHWNLPLIDKWRDHVHLVTSYTWPVEDPPVPAWLVRSLRKDAKPGALLPFNDLTAAADLLSEKQLMRLGSEFPVMLYVSRARGILALLHRQPALARRALDPQGLPLTPDVVAALRELPPSPLFSTLDSGEARLLTIKIVTDEKATPPSRQVIFQLRGEGGKHLMGLGFTDYPQPPAPAPQ